MLALIRDLDAFYLEHRRCGELDADVEGERVRMACECGARLVRDGFRLDSGVEAPLQ